MPHPPMKIYSKFGHLSILKKFVTFQSFHLLSKPPVKIEILSSFPKNVKIEIFINLPTKVHIEILIKLAENYLGKCK